VKYEFLSIMRDQFVVTHTVPYVEISASLDRCVTDRLSAKILYPQKNYFPYIFVKSDILENLWRYFSPRVKLHIFVLRQIADSWAISLRFMIQSGRPESTVCYC
jgi:hypothetical protein